MQSGSLWGSSAGYKATTGSNWEKKVVHQPTPVLQTPCICLVPFSSQRTSTSIISFVTLNTAVRQTEHVLEFHFINAQIRLKAYTSSAVLNDKERDSNLTVFGRERSRWLSSRRHSFLERTQMRNFSPIFWLPSVVQDHFQAQISSKLRFSLITRCL